MDVSRVQRRGWPASDRRCWLRVVNNRAAEVREIAKPPGLKTSQAIDGGALVADESPAEEVDGKWVLFSVG